MQRSCQKIGFQFNIAAPQHWRPTMAQTITYLNRSRDPAGKVQARASHLLGVEKMGVILGFLVGLPVGFLLVGQALTTLGTPGWVTFIVGALVAAVFTRTGQMIALAFNKAERFDAKSEDL
jgi:hypothetical protein